VKLDISQKTKKVSSRSKCLHYFTDLHFIFTIILFKSSDTFISHRYHISNMISPEQYVNTWTFFMAAYAVQMMFTPGKMVTDHFDVPVTPMVKFWVRGQAPAWAAVCYCITQKLETSDAVQICTVLSISIGLCYPWNAKFDFTGDKLPVKYPMHYVPEILMAALSGVGLLIIFG
jgi:hypothetical protein